MTTEKQTNYFAEVISVFRHRLASAQQVIVDFGKDFAKNPGYALEWSSEAFTAAATIDVLGEILRAAVTIKTLRDYCLERAMNGAQYPARSTSVSSNLIADCRTSEWAHAFKLLDGCLFCVDTLPQLG